MYRIRINPGTTTSDIVCSEIKNHTIAENILLNACIENRLGNEYVIEEYEIPAGRYSLTELFGWYVQMPIPNKSAPDEWVTPYPCSLCGCAVYKPTRHQEWHNTIL